MQCSRQPLQEPGDSTGLGCCFWHCCQAYLEWFLCRCIASTWSCSRDLNPLLCSGPAHCALREHASSAIPEAWPACAVLRACKTIEIADVRIPSIWQGLGLPHGRPVYSCTTSAWSLGMEGSQLGQSLQADPTLLFLKRRCRRQLLQGLCPTRCGHELKHAHTNDSDLLAHDAPAVVALACAIDSGGAAAGSHQTPSLWPKPLS